MQPIIIKSRNVRIEDGPQEHPSGKRVELLSDGGVVHAIQLCCACGERTVVELEYDRPETLEATDEA